MTGVTRGGRTKGGEEGKGEEGIGEGGEEGKILAHGTDGTDGTDQPKVVQEVLADLKIWRFGRMSP